MIYDVKSPLFRSFLSQNGGSSDKRWKVDNMLINDDRRPIFYQRVGNAFVQQYYHILHHSPELVHRFYKDISKVGRPKDDGSMSITTTRQIQAINDKILSLNYGEIRAEIKYVDAQESFIAGVHVLVIGYLTGKDNITRNFTQSFLLAPQDRGYFVLNDMFRYVDNANHHDGNWGSVSEVEAPLTPGQAEAAAAAQQTVSAQVVGKAFVQQYYHILPQSPQLVHRFYQDISKLGHPEDDGSMSITTTMHAINDKILSLNYGKIRAEIKYVDAQESFNAGVHVLVIGYLTGKDNIMRNFTQSFFLAPQDRGYFVLNDMFRYVENANHHDGNQGSVSEVDAPLTPEQEPSPVQVNHISEQTTVLAEEANGEDAYNPSENGEVSVVEEDVPVAEIVDEVQDKWVAESDIKIEEVPKKSCASIVMDLKQTGVPFSSPAPALRKSPPKSQEQHVSPALPAASAAEVPVSSSDVVENGNNEGEGMQSPIISLLVYLGIMILWILIEQLV